MQKPGKWQIAIVLMIGITGVSLAAIWVRLAFAAAGMENTVNNKVGFSLFLAASRLIVAALILLPAWKKIKSARISAIACYYAIAAGICLALHFAAWITSLAYTSVTASTVLVTTNPIWVGLLSWWWYQEKLTTRQILSIAIALIGGAVIAFADSSGSSYENQIFGDMLALVGAVMSSLYILFGSQAQKKGLATGYYIAIAYSTAAICLLPLPFIAQTGYAGYAPLVYLYVFLMAVVSQIIGHTSLNWSVRWISPTLISLSLLFEPVIASVFGVLILQEVPSLNLLLGGLIILLGIGIFLSTDFKQQSNT